jgi:hypothetical protein
MKQIAVAFKALLLIAVLASLAACKGGTFTDPGHEASGFTGSGENTGGKPARLSRNASYKEAVAKIDEIIAYCEAHPGLENDAVKGSARQTRSMLSMYGVEDNWNSIRDIIIDEIDFYISGLR